MTSRPLKSTKTARERWRRHPQSYLVTPEYSFPSCIQPESGSARPCGAEHERPWMSLFVGSRSAAVARVNDQRILLRSCRTTSEISLAEELRRRGPASTMRGDRVDSA